MADEQPKPPPPAEPPPGPIRDNPRENTLPRDEYKSDRSSPRVATDPRGDRFSENPPRTEKL